MSRHNNQTDKYATEAILRHFSPGLLLNKHIRKRLIMTLSVMNSAFSATYQAFWNKYWCCNEQKPDYSPLHPSV